MRVALSGIILILISITFSANAQLQPWADYEISDKVWSVTTVRVDPNMDDDYLAGLRDSWVAANKVAKSLGQIVDYAIYRSETPQSGDFNLFLVVEFENSAALEPNKETYDAFMKEWGEQRQERSREIVKDYPSMRSITGEYRVRKIDIK